MKSTKTTPRRFFGGKTLFSLFFILILALTTLVLSGKFEELISPFAPILKPSATVNQPNTRESFQDAFNDGIINSKWWVVSKTDGVTVIETPNDDLRMVTQEGSQNNKPRRGTLVAKSTIGRGKDFLIRAELYRPVVTGNGLGQSGICFISTSAYDDEVASVQWRVGEGKSDLVFVVRAPDGTLLEAAKVPLVANRAVLRLIRVGKKYRADYKPGADNPDVAWKAIGKEQDDSLGGSGRLSLYISNSTGGKNPGYPKLIGRFDTAFVGWEP